MGRPRPPKETPVRPEADLPPATPDLDALTAKLRTRSGRSWWRSLEEIAETPEFRRLLQREFPSHAAEWDEGDEGFSRRRFLELAGASLALGGLAACTRQPQEQIIPYVKQPEEVLPGRPLFFATAFPLAGYATGLIVESNTGRPTKIEGNPDHPSSLGATDAFAQASVLGLYDPDRSQTITEFGKIRTWTALADAVGAKMTPLRGLKGEGLRILTGTVTSPTLAGQLASLLAALPKAKWHQWEAAGRDRVRAGARLAFGRDVEIRYDFGNADVVVALDADPFVEGPGHLVHARSFARRRRAQAVDPTAAPLRFYSVETTPTASGVLADHRLTVGPADLPAAAVALGATLGLPGVDIPSGLGEARKAFFDAAAADLLKSRGRAIVVAGEYAAPGVHALAVAINQRLGALGTTLLVTDPVEANPVDQAASIRDLAADLDAGKVDLLVILGGNPVFDAPADLDFGNALKKAGLRVHLSLYDDETSAYCQWHVPEAHYLETWGDSRGHDGTAVIQQPLVDPLYGGSSPLEIVHLLSVAGTEAPQKAPPMEIVKTHWQKARGGADFEPFWRKSLNDGSVAGTTLPPMEIAPTPGAAASAAAALGVGARAFASSTDALTILFRPDPGIFDGRFANNPWLQELPRPLTKLTWDNAAHVSVATAQKMGAKTGDVVTLAVKGRSIEAPVLILPGQPDGTVTLHYGHGRTRAGQVGNGTGFDAFPIRTSDALWEAPVTAAKTGRRHELVTTQHHFNMEGRNLVRAGTLALYRQNPGFVAEMNEPEPKDVSLYPGFEYKNHAWGMSVNLSACTGCNACVVACVSENNIPTVGKDQVRRGREMQWIRIDRYYEGSPAGPVALNQPVFCMHCEKAPCEVVCPVAATTHSEEGLNEMTYNRCVGTRYCSNNCPYKVRRFNFYDFNKDKWLPSLTAAANPDVTVRTLGVMEKCTYCVQRINRARIDAERENRPLRDGEIRTACQQVCPTEALVFGDVNDPASRVSALKKEPLNYALLGSLDTRPRTTYLAKLSNPNPALPGDEG
ncbi:MAG: TAT-variant-translocated molybdopterin oxidoreductase [Acidithiobacillales bacterium]